MIELVEAWLQAKQTTLWGCDSSDVSQPDSRRRCAEWFLKEVGAFNSYLLDSLTSDRDNPLWPA